jgi:hypothetical protein
MHDPFQSYAAMSTPYGAHLGNVNPMGIPYNVQAPTINPLAGIHPLAAAALGLSQAAINPLNGIPQTGPQGLGQYPAQSFINPQQLQLASALAQQALIPQLLGQQSPFAFHNPMVAALLSNPGLQAQYGGHQFGQQPHSLYSQFTQNGASPFGQPGLPGIGYPLAPQSWVGQGGQAFGPRPFQGQAMSPWGYQ